MSENSPSNSSIDIQNWILSRYPYIDRDYFQNCLTDEVNRVKNKSLSNNDSANFRLPENIWISPDDPLVVEHISKLEDDLTALINDACHANNQDPSRMLALEAMKHLFSTKGRAIFPACKQHVFSRISSCLKELSKDTEVIKLAISPTVAIGLTSLGELNETARLDLLATYKDLWSDKAIIGGMEATRVLSIMLEQEMTRPEKEMSLKIQIELLDNLLELKFAGSGPLFSAIAENHPIKSIREKAVQNLQIWQESVLTKWDQTTVDPVSTLEERARSTAQYISLGNRIDSTIQVIFNHNKGANLEGEQDPRITLLAPLLNHESEKMRLAAALVLTQLEGLTVLPKESVYSVRVIAQIALSGKKLGSMQDAVKILENLRSKQILKELVETEIERATQVFLENQMADNA